LGLKYLLTGTEYFAALQEFGILNIVHSFKNKMKMITFLKTHLIGCVREKNLEVFNDLVLFISNSHLHAQEWTLDKEDLKVIIHHKTNDVNSLFYKTARMRTMTG
jgi:hypothetical protein